MITRIQLYLRTLTHSPFSIIVIVMSNAHSIYVCVCMAYMVIQFNFNFNFTLVYHRESVLERQRI